MSYKLGSDLIKDGFGGNLNILGLMSEPENKVIKYIGRLDSYEGISIICYNEEKEILFDCLFESADSIADWAWVKKNRELKEKDLTKDEIEKEVEEEVGAYYKEWTTKEYSCEIEDFLWQMYVDDGKYTFAEELVYL